MAMFQVLVVDDDANDRELLLKAFKEHDLEVEVNTCSDGEEALRFLKKEGEFQKAATPQLILLDLNMPKMNGHEFLVALRKDKRFLKVNVVVLTTSKAQVDRLKAEPLGIHSFLTKPTGVAETAQLVFFLKELIGLLK